MIELLKVIQPLLLVILAWLILMERRISRIEGKIDFLYNMLNRRKERLPYAPS